MARDATKKLLDTAEGILLANLKGIAGIDSEPFLDRSTVETVAQIISVEHAILENRQLAAQITSLVTLRDCCEDLKRRAGERDE